MFHVVAPSTVQEVRGRTHPVSFAEAAMVTSRGSCNEADQHKQAQTNDQTPQTFHSDPPISHLHVKLLYSNHGVLSF